jgi:hypothetical protein
MKGGTVTLFLMFSMSNSTCSPFPNGSRKFRLSSVSTFKRSRTLFPVLTFTFWNCLVWLIVTALMVLKKPVRAQVFVVQNSSSFRGLLGSKSEWKEGYQSKASVEGPTPFNILPPIWLSNLSADDLAALGRGQGTRCNEFCKHKSPLQKILWAGYSKAF